MSLRPHEEGFLTVAVPADGYHRQLISCQQACPVHTDARGYVRAIARGEFDEAYLIARGPNPFASMCGRICGAPCEAACRRGKIPRVGPDGEFIAQDRPIAIRALKRFACELYGAESREPSEVLSSVRGYVPSVSADIEEMAALIRSSVRPGIEPVAGKKAAIIGGGPAGLSAGHDLALLGFDVTVYELEKVPGGMLGVGVPVYRLPRELIRREIAVIEALGVRIRYGCRVGEDISFQQLLEESDAVIIAVGAKRSRGLGLPGESGPGVLGGVDLLRASALGETLDLGERIVVIGGGNVAYDVARTVVRQAAYDTARTAARQRKTQHVSLVSLETLEEMPADTVEIREGDEEGVERLNGWGPTEILRDEQGKVSGVRFQQCLRVYDEQRRFSPRFDSQATRTVPCDTVLLAVGQSPDLSFLEPGKLEEVRPGWPRIDPKTLMSSVPGVFIAGDLAHGTRLLIDAVASGKAAARSVYEYVTGHRIQPGTLELNLVLPGYRRESGYEMVGRVELPVLEPAERLAEPDASVEQVLSEDEAKREASRCLDCGVTPVFDGNRCVLCGGCVDVCPTQCLKLSPLDSLRMDPELALVIDAALGSGADLSGNSMILKDEDRCIRCGLCAQRCPSDAITMERIQFTSTWRFE